MTIGDWEITEEGQVIHLKCGIQPSWSFSHRCWHMNTPDIYTDIEVPVMLQTIAIIRYSVWVKERNSGQS